MSLIYHHDIFCLYLDACFSRFEVGALERAELEQLTRWNRDLAKIMLAAGCLLLLPPVLVALSSSVLLGMGEAVLLGWPVAFCLPVALAVWMVMQVLLVGLLVLLCTFCMEWEPLGFVLALAELLHTTPGVLQNMWRSLVILPLIGWLLYVCG